MVLNLTPEQEALIRSTAEVEGRTVEELFLETLSAFIQQEDADRDSIQRGIEQADCGEFIEEDEMKRRFAQMLRR